MCASPAPDDDPNKEKARRLRVALEDKAAELERKKVGIVASGQAPGRAGFHARN